MLAEPDLRPASPPVAELGASSGAPADMQISVLRAVDTGRFAGPAGPDTAMTEDVPPPSSASATVVPDDQPPVQREPAGLSVADLHAAKEAAQQAVPAGPDALLVEEPLQWEPPVGERPVFMGE
eukprot:9610871-Alexandrium_andersonii.AAC.1